MGERGDTAERHRLKPGVGGADAAGGADVAPTWATWREAVRVVACRRHLRTTIRIALVVGTILFAINQLDVVLRGDAGPIVWVKVVVTYLVPFAVCNLGILAATRRAGS